MTKDRRRVSDFQSPFAKYPDPGQERRRQWARAPHGTREILNFWASPSPRPGSDGEYRRAESFGGLPQLFVLGSQRHTEAHGQFEIGRIVGRESFGPG